MSHLIRDPLMAASVNAARGRRTRSPRWWGWLGAAVVPFLLASCTAYHARPLAPADAIGASASADLVQVAVSAATLKHPLLAPMTVNVADGLTPDEAALLAVAANPDLRAARAARGVAEAQLVAAGILPNPQISGAVDVPVRHTANTVDAVSLGAAIDLLGIATRGAEQDAARRGLQSVDLGVAWLEWQVAQSVRLRVYDVMLVERARTLSMQQERGLEATVTTLRAAVAKQVATRVELGAAEVAYRTVISARITLDMQRDTARVSLARAVGVDEASLPPIQETPVPFDGDSSLAFAQEVPTLQELMKEFGSRRLDLQGLRFGYLSQEARVRAAVIRQFPQINVGVNRIRDTGNLLTLGPAATLFFPLFNRNQGEIAVARATRSQLKAEYDARVFDTRATVQILLAELSSTVKRLQNLRASVGVQQQTVELYRRALQGGNADVLTYYTVRSDLMNRQLEVVATLRNLVELAIALETETGTRFTSSTR
ncbi:MAG: TolC family protein [Gemmatimonadota bacterium]